MDEAVDVRPFEPMSVGCGPPHPTFGPAAPQHALGPEPGFILKPHLDRAIWVGGLQVIDERLDFFCMPAAVLGWPLEDDGDVVAARYT